MLRTSKAPGGATEPAMGVARLDAGCWDVEARRSFVRLHLHRLCGTLIPSAAERAERDTVYSEDLSDGQSDGSVQVTNPC